MSGGQVTAQYVHELDWGTGPLVGFPLMVTPANRDEAFDPVRELCNPLSRKPGGILDCMEGQSREANSGVAARGRIEGVEIGFWYDPVTGLYNQEPAGARLTRRDLLAQIVEPRDHLTFTAIPLGSERRIASPDGRTSIQPQGPPPGSLALLPMIPNTANRDISTQHIVWADLDNERQKSNFVHTIRIYQHVLIGKAPGGFGVDKVRHDAPRRFRIAGRNIRHGAELHLFSVEFSDGSQTVRNPVSLAEARLAQIPTRRSVFPLYATGELASDGLPIWETAVELEPLVYYQLMLGWVSAPGVSEVFTDIDQCPSTSPQQPPCFLFSDPPTQSELDLFDPVNWNYHFLRVVNRDGSSGEGGWQRVTIE